VTATNILSRQPISYSKMGCSVSKKGNYSQSLNTRKLDSTISEIWALHFGQLIRAIGKGLQPSQFGFDAPQYADEQLLSLGNLRWVIGSP
jgi:hypothetical protein